jgi:hypothetical protein
MTNLPSKTTPPLFISVLPEDLEEQIQRRAYELYLARGREDGHDLEDWLRAEAEITNKATKAAA